MQNTKQKSENKSLLKALHEKNSNSAVVDKSVIATLKTSDNKSSATVDSKSSTDAKSESVHRDVTKFIVKAVDKKDLNSYERRSYMNKDIDAEHAQLFLSDNEKEHCTVYFDSVTNSIQRLTKAIAKQKIKEYMTAHSEQKVFRTSDFQRMLQSASSSYTDMIRSACRQLERESFLTVELIADNERTREKYQYRTLIKDVRSRNSNNELE